MAEVADIIKDLNFEVHGSRFNTEDKAVLIALKNSKEKFRSLSDHERKRKFKLVESIRESANIIDNFFDAMEEEDFEDLEVQKEVSNE